MSDFDNKPLRKVTDSTTSLSKRLVWKIIGLKGSSGQKWNMKSYLKYLNQHLTSTEPFCYQRARNQHQKRFNEHVPLSTSMHWADG